MPIRPGQYLGGVRDLATLRDRCVIDRHTGCWHFRQPRDGRAASQRYSHTVHVHGRGKVSVTRAAWEFSGRTPPSTRTHRVARTCSSYDCANPEHLAALTLREAHELTRQRFGPLLAALHRAGTAEAARRRPDTKLTAELAQWIRDSRQSCAQVAAALGISKSRAIAVRAGKVWR